MAHHTLGCKVNQYDTQAMAESFERAGYQIVPFLDEADVYLINTCTVTGTGDKKSLNLIRRVARQHPQSDIIVAGCLAQRDAERVALHRVRMTIGVKHRARVVELYERAVREGRTVDAVSEPGDWSFEELSVSRHELKTRATMKIQEGCDRYCAYCIIPHVRGPVRSMPIDAVAREAERLAGAGYRELVVTGIHLASYGRGRGYGLADAITAIAGVPGVHRIRLGSLEPGIVTEEFIEAIRPLKALCPHFHLSLQSGSDGVLKRMGRRYTADEYLRAAGMLRAAYPDCGLSTDILTGFPGETDREAEETVAFIRQVGFSRIHVFPYSRREGTPADRMPGQVNGDIKKKRVLELIEIGNQLEEGFVQSLLGTDGEVLFEERLSDGMSEGYTGNYVRVRAQAEPGDMLRVRLIGRDGAVALGQRINGKE